MTLVGPSPTRLMRALAPGALVSFSLQTMRITALVVSTVCVLAALAAGTKHSGPWELEDSGSIAGLRGVHAVGGGVVWASGAGGTILRSEDTGYLWQQCAVPPGATKLDFRAIWAWDAQNALALSSGPGDKSRLYQTTDGCNSWKLLLTNPDATGFWDGMLFLKRQQGVIYGDPVRVPERTDHVRFGLLVTQNGGKTWSPGAPLEPLPGESAFAASNSAMSTSGDWIWLGLARRGYCGPGTWSRGRAHKLRWQAEMTPPASFP